MTSSWHLFPWLTPRIPWVYDDGGRWVSGRRYRVGDCALRACAIASRWPYLEVLERFQDLARAERKPPHLRSHPEHGVYRRVYHRFLTRDLRARYRTTPPGTLLRVGVVPYRGRFVLSLAKHLTAVVDGVVHDTYHPCECGDRRVWSIYEVPDSSFNRAWRL